MKTLSSKTKTHVLAAIGAAIGIAVAILIRWPSSHSPSHPAAAGTVPVASPSASVAEVVATHLGWADQQASAGLAPQLSPLRDFFVGAKAGTRAFAEDALGWSSKWKFVKEQVAGGDEHRRFLAERFRVRVFAQEDLEKTLKYAVAAYMTHLDNVDSMLLVKLKADLASIPSSGFSAAADPALIEQSLNRAIHDAVRAVEAEFPGAVGREVVSYVAGELLGMAAGRLATSAGILSVGAYSGMASAGAGIVLSIIIDYVVSWAYEKWADPIGKMSRKLDGTLTQLEQVIIEGHGEEPGLYKRLLNYGARRSQARRTAIHSVVRP